MHAPKELAPEEDQGAVVCDGNGPTIGNVALHGIIYQPIRYHLSRCEVMSDYFTVNGMSTVNSVISALILKPWNERKQTSKEANKQIQTAFNQLGGLQIQAFPLPPLPTGGSPIPLQFEITSTQSLKILYPIMENMVAAARKSGLFLFVSGSLKFNKPQMDLVINREKAAQMGISMAQVGQSLATAYSGNYVNRFSMDNRSYEVIPQVAQRFRFNPGKHSGRVFKNCNRPDDFIGNDCQHSLFHPAESIDAFSAIKFG